MLRLRTPIIHMTFNIYHIILILIWLLYIVINVCVWKQKRKGRKKTLFYIELIYHISYELQSSKLEYRYCILRCRWSKLHLLLFMLNNCQWHYGSYVTIIQSLVASHSQVTLLTDCTDGHTYISGHQHRPVIYLYFLHIMYNCIGNISIQLLCTKR